MAKKAKKQKIDGLGPDDLKLIHKAVRQVWSWSYPRRLCIQRAIGADGFVVCEECRQKVPKVTADHIIPVGEVGGQDYIKRMWCPSYGLRAICLKCHRRKTKLERMKGFK